MKMTSAPATAVATVVPQAAVATGMPAATVAEAAAAAVTYVLIIGDDAAEDTSAAGGDFPPRAVTAIYVHGTTDIVLLSLLVIATFVSNAVLAAAVALNRYLRRTPFCSVLLALAVLNTLDCLVTGTVSLAYMSRITWTMGEVVCRAHAWLTRAICSARPLWLLQMAVDRYAALQWSDDSYRTRLSRGRQQVALAVTLLSMAAMSGPYACGWLPAGPFPARMGCGSSNVVFADPAYGYAAFLLVTTVVIPAASLLIFAVVFVHLLWADWRLRKRIHARAWLESQGAAAVVLSNSTASRQEELAPPLDSYQTRGVWAWLGLLASFVLGVLPYVVHDAVDQLSPMAARGPSPSSYSSASSSATGQDRQPVQEICRTPHADALLAWLRFLSLWADAVIVLATSEDIRQEVVFLLSRANDSDATTLSGSTAGGTRDEVAVASLAASRILVPAAGSSSHRKCWWWMCPPRTRAKEGRRGAVARKETRGQIGALPPPILFPSPLGLCLRRSLNPSATTYRYKLCESFVHECCRQMALRPPPPLRPKGPPPIDSVGRRRAVSLDRNVKRRRDLRNGDMENRHYNSDAREDGHLQNRRQRGGGHFKNSSGLTPVDVSSGGRRTYNDLSKGKLIIEFDGVGARRGGARHRRPPPSPPRQQSQSVVRNRSKSTGRLSDEINPFVVGESWQRRDSIPRSRRNTNRRANEIPAILSAKLMKSSLTAMQ